MTTRPMGRNGPAVAALGLGCMSLSGAYGDADAAAQTHIAELGGDQHLAASALDGLRHQ